MLAGLNLRKRESRSRAVSILTCVAATLVIFAPGIVFIADGPSHTNENRELSDLPGRDAGWNYFESLGNFISDRLPLRPYAVRADAWVDTHLFREDPAFGGAAIPGIITGDQGFLFLAGEVEIACAPTAPAASTVANLAELARIIKASGRDVVTMVVPNKSSVHPELLPHDMADRDCFDAYVEDLWSGLATAGIDGFFDLRTVLTRESEATGEPLFFRTDSHWDPAGSLVAVQAMVDHFAPGLWSDEEVHDEGLVCCFGDISMLMGAPAEEGVRSYSIVRPDVTHVSTTVIDGIVGAANRRFVNAAPDGRLITGRTVMFLDSTGLRAMAQIVPFFEDLTVIHLNDYEPQRFLDAIESSDRVWIMSVERDAPARFELSVGSNAFRELLGQHLSQRD